MRFIGTIALIAIAASATVDAHATTTTRPGSFLRTPARSARDFAARVRKDSVLQKRYGKYLALPWRSVPDYFERHLRAGFVGKAGFFTVHNVTPEGIVYPTKQWLASRTRVYRLERSSVSFSAYGDPITPFHTPVVTRKARARRQKSAQPRAVERVQMMHVPSE